jgi:hypothetical protein
VVKEVQAGRRQLSIISAHQTDDLTVWQELERELGSEDISRHNIVRHKEDLKMYLKGLLEESILESPSPLYAPPVFQSDNGDDKRDSISIRMPCGEETERPDICAAKIARAQKANIVAGTLYRLTHSPIDLVKAAACDDVTLVNQLLQKGGSVAEKWEVRE